MHSMFVILRHQKTIIAVLILAIVGIVTIAHGASQLYVFAPETESTQERIEVEVINIRPDGLDPAEIRRQQGRFLLVVNNQSGINELVLRLDSETAARLYEVRLPKGKKHWRTMVDLQPGRYVLTESGHPDRAAYIIITAR